MANAILTTAGISSLLPILCTRVYAVNTERAQYAVTTLYMGREVKVYNYLSLALEKNVLNVLFKAYKNISASQWTRKYLFAHEQNIFL